MDVRSLAAALVGTFALTQVVLAPTMASAAAAPPPPDCVPDSTTAPTDPPVGSGTNSISGIVGAEGADTIAGVDVTAHDDMYTYSYTVQTDVDGVFTFNGLEDGTWVVGLTEPGYVPEYYCGAPDEWTATPISVAGGAHVDDVNLLVGPRSITGTISAGGSPVVGAWVVVADDNTTEIATTTGAGGEFSIGGLDDGTYTVRTVPVGGPVWWYPGVVADWEATQVTLDAATPTFDASFSLATGGVAGQVTSDGVPWSNQFVVVTSVYDPVSVQVETDASGNFSVDHLPAGDYTVLGLLEMVSAVPLAGPISVDGVSTVGPLALVLHSGTVSGTVTRGGQPIDGFMETFGSRVLTVDETTSVEGEQTDSAGNFVVRGLDTGDYYVGVVDYTTGDQWWFPGVRDLIDATAVSVTDGADAPVVIDLPGTSLITGRVTDQAMNAVVGAQVAALDEGETEVAWATTDGNGDYGLAVPDGDYRIRVVPSGAPRARWYDGVTDFWSATPVTVAGADVASIDVTFTRSGFSGVLDDGVDPVQFTTVTAFDVDADPTMPGGSASVTTNEFGEFAFEFLPAGDYRVSAYEPNSGMLIEVGSATSDGATVATGLSFSFPNGSVSGTITIGGLTPQASGYDVDLSLSRIDGAGGADVFVSGDGAYTFTTLADGQYELLAVVRVDGTYGIRYPGSITVAGGAVTDIDLDLPVPATIQGTITAPGGAAISTTVLLVRGPNCMPGGFINGTTSNGIGYYEFEVMPGDYCVVVSYDGYSFASPGVYVSEVYQSGGYPLIAASAGSTVVADVAIPAPSTISGRVTDGVDGVADVDVVIQGRYPWDPAEVLATTDLDGTYTTTPRYDQSLRIGFRPQDGSLAPVYYPDAPSIAGATPIDLTGGDVTGINAVVAPYASLSGTITAPDGNITRAVVRAWDAATDFSEFGTPVAQIETLDGSYDFGQLPPGDYVVSASPYWDEPIEWAATYYATPDPVVEWDLATTVALLPGGSTIIDIRAAFGGSIVGTVVDAAGDPLAGIVVNASPDDNDPRFEWRKTVTDAQGAYRLTGLAPGDFRVFAGPNGQTSWILGEYWENQRFDPAAPANVNVAASGPAPIVDFQLETGIPAYVTLVDDSGPVTPPNGFFWSIPTICIAPDLPSAGTQCDTAIGTSISIGPDGYYVGGLHDTTYNIAMELDGIVGDVETFTPSFGDRVECVLAVPGSSQTSACSVVPDTGGATISGTVIDAFGDPKPGVVVNLHDGEQTVLPIGGYTRGDGTYTIDNVPPGTYQLKFGNPYRPGVLDPTLDEWYSASGQAYSDDYDQAEDIVVIGTETISGLDAQLDIPNTGIVAVGDGTPISDLFVVACTAPAVYDGGFGCDDGTFGNFGETSGNTSTFGYLLPGDYTFVAAQGSFWSGPTVITDPVTVSLPVNSTFECTLPLIGAGTPSCTVTPISFVDDNDGVDPVEEGGAPNNGDGNNDGTPDNEQNSVASLVDPSIPDSDVDGDGVNDGTNYLTIEASIDPNGAGGNYPQPKPLANVSLVQPTVAPPAGVTPQSSLVSFEVGDLEAGDTVELRIYLPQPANSYWKYDDATNTWSDYTSLATFTGPVEIGGVTRWGVTLSIVDGGFGDDDGAADGRVVDPGVFALTEQIPPVVELTGIAAGQVFTVSEPIDAACITTDDGSGVATDASLTISPVGEPHGDGVGWFTATCDGASDRVGNEAPAITRSFRVVYDRADGVFTGGSAAISPAVNTGKAGRTYALRWELYRADGSRVTDGTGTSWTVFDVSCEFIDGEEDPLPEGESTDGSTFRVSADGEFQLNLKTAKDPGCRILLISLVDGSSIVARFDLR